MPTQFSTLLKLALPVQGELSGTWGDTVNDGVTNMIEEAIAGRRLSTLGFQLRDSFHLATVRQLSLELRCSTLLIQAPRSLALLQ